MNSTSRPGAPWKKFFRNALRPHLRTVLQPGYWIISAGLAVVAFSASLLFEPGGPRAVSLVVISYSSIALGFTVTALTVLTGLPEQGFLRTLSTVGLYAENGSARELPSERLSAFTDLVFVFVISAVAHILLTAVVLLVEFGSALVGDMIPYRWTVVAVVWTVLAFLTSYSVHRFFLSIITLQQFLDARRIWSLWAEYLECEVGRETSALTEFEISLPSSVHPQLHAHGIDLSNWIVASTQGHEAVLPWGTNLAPGQKVRVCLGTSEVRRTSDVIVVESASGNTAIDYFLYNREGVPVRRFVKGDV
jgi:hypothetical protein